jgi:hypothetical protein
MLIRLHHSEGSYKAVGAWAAGIPVGAAFRPGGWGPRPGGRERHPTGQRDMGRVKSTGDFDGPLTATMGQERLEVVPP